MQATAIPMYFRIFLTTSYPRKNVLPVKRSHHSHLPAPLVLMIKNAFEEVGMRLLERQEPNLS